MLPFLCTVYTDGIAQCIVTQPIDYLVLFTWRSLYMHLVYNRHYQRHGEHAIVGGRIGGWVGLLL